MTGPVPEAPPVAIAGAEATPLARLMSLDVRKQRAFLALFAGARLDLMAFTWADGRERAPSFGKAECGWVDDWRDFYGRELPTLGLLTFDEGEPRPALGMAPGSVFREIRIGITENGRVAREAWWAERDRKAREWEAEHGGED